MCSWWGLTLWRLILTCPVLWLICCHAFSCPALLILCLAVVLMWITCLVFVTGPHLWIHTEPACVCVCAQGLIIRTLSAGTLASISSPVAPGNSASRLPHPHTHTHTHTHTHSPTPSELQGLASGPGRSSASYCLQNPWVQWDPIGASLLYCFESVWMRFTHRIF